LAVVARRNHHQGPSHSGGGRQTGSGTWSGRSGTSISNIGFAADTCPGDERDPCPVAAHQSGRGHGRRRGPGDDVPGSRANETPTLMAAADRPVAPTGRSPRGRAEDREVKWLRPDAKSQVTVEYHADGTPNRIHTRRPFDPARRVGHDGKAGADGCDYFTDAARQQVIRSDHSPRLEGRPARFDQGGSW